MRLYTALLSFSLAASTWVTVGAFLSSNPHPSALVHTPAAQTLALQAFSVTAESWCAPSPRDVCDQTGVTLSRYILESVRANPELQGIDSICTALQTACKAISQLIRNAPFTDLHGLHDGGGSVNVQGEEQTKLDVAANKVLKNALKWSGQFTSLLSEEEEHPVPLLDNFGHQVYSGDVVLTAEMGNRYVAAFDPLDGSSNVDAGIPTGTIFGIFESTPVSKTHAKTKTLHEQTLQSILQPGRNLVAAGYCLYSSAVTLVLSLGSGVMGFTLDEAIGEFRLTHPYMVIPSRGRVYSFNEANRPDWTPPLQRYIDNLQKGNGETGQRYTSRYIGSLVGDVHRTLLYGGIFGYPEDRKNPNGKLRLLYEAAPMAFLVEQAGGKAVTGKKRILDVVPQSVHERVSCILGSPQDVNECSQYIGSSGDMNKLNQEGSTIWDDYDESFSYKERRENALVD